jgi:arylsulfatase A-like enzyme
VAETRSAQDFPASGLGEPSLAGPTVRRVRRRRALRWAAAGIANVAAFAGCSPSPARPNVILISLDTLRADAVGRYGDRRDTSPNLDAFLGQSLVFTRAYAPEPHTLTSHMSLFTSLHPISHGVEGKLSGGMALAPHIPTLTGELAKAGYTTAAFVNGGFLHPRFGLKREFDHYDYFSDIERGPAPGETRLGRTAAETNEVVFAWLDAHADEPFFLFVHYFDPHSDWTARPYDSPAEYREEFAGPTAARSDWESTGAGGSTFLESANRQRRQLSDALREELRALYHAGVRYTDDRFGELVAGLRDRGIFDDALVVLLADHGEEFQEHGRLLHTQLYEECVRIPMGLRLPGGVAAGNAERHELVGIVDVMPTILDRLGLPEPAGLQGHSLLPLANAGAETNDATWQDRALFFVSGASGRFALRREDWKFYSDLDGGTLELYDLASDPDERQNLAGRDWDAATQALSELQRWRANAPAPYREAKPEPVDLDDATIRQLRSLGYAGD